MRRSLVITGTALFFCALVVLVGTRIYYGPVKIISIGKIDGDSTKCVDLSDALGYSFRPNCETIFQPSEGRAIQIKYNSNGFRDRDYPKKTRRRHRVLIIGDSQMVGARLPDEKTFPRRLEAAWRRDGYDVEVINGAMLGASLMQVYLLLANAIEAYRPDGVILVTAVTGKSNAKLFHQQPFLEVDPISKVPLRIRKNRFDEFTPGILDWGSNGIRASVNQRTFLELVGNCRRSWKCTLKPLEKGGDCMLGDYFSLLKLIRDRSLESGAKFLFVSYGNDFENSVSAGAWDLPWFLRLIAWITPKLTIAKEDWLASLVRDGIPTLVLDYSILVSHIRDGGDFRDDNVHFTADVFEKTVDRYSEEIARALPISKK